MIRIPFLELSRRRGFFGLILLGFIIYLPIFLKPPYFAVSDFALWLKDGMISYHRPVTFVFFKLVMPIFQLNPLGYYFLSVTLHIFNALLVYILAKFFIQDNKFSFLAAAFFLVHYISADTILCIHDFEIILSSFFYLISIICFMKTLTASGFKNIFLASSIITYLFALGSRESVFSLPLVICACGILMAKDNIYPKFKSLLRYYAPYFIITVIILLFLADKGYYVYRVGERLDFVRYNFSGLIINTAIFLEALFIPFNFQYATNSFWQISAHSLPIALFITIIFIFLIFWVNDRKFKFSLLWIFLTIAPFLPRPPQSKEIYLYLPLAGMAIFLSLLLNAGVQGIVRSDKNKIYAKTIGVYLPVLLLVSLSVSSLVRIFEREKAGQVSRIILHSVSESLRADSKNTLIYAFWFPIDVNRFLVGNYRTKEIAPFIHWGEKNKVDWRKSWFSIDCRGGRDERIDPREGLYALTLNRKIKKKIRKELTISGDSDSDLVDFAIEKIGPAITGLDTLFPPAFKRYVFCYQGKEVFDLTDKVFPETKVIFRVKGPRIKNIAISGDFNQWDKKDYFLVNNNGVWEKTILLSPGKYLYKFIINGGKEISNPNSEYSIDDPKKGSCSILAIINPALPIGLLPSGNDAYDKKVIESKERLLINSEDALLHKKLFLLYRQRGFYKEAAIECQVMEEIIKKGSN